MEMKIINSEKRLCTCCMEEHDVKTVLVREQSTFKGVEVNYDAVYYKKRGFAITGLVYQSMPMGAVVCKKLTDLEGYLQS